MNSSDFIDEQINLYKAIVSITSGKKKSYYKKVVNKLKQVKVELEAWEVLKHTFHIQAINRFNKIPGILIQTLDEEILENVDFEDYEKLKKALEVEDE